MNGFILKVLSVQLQVLSKINLVSFAFCNSGLSLQKKKTHPDNKNGVYELKRYTQTVKSSKNGDHRGEIGQENCEAGNLLAIFDERHISISITRRSR
jgi:hypothetical protein